MKYRNGRQVSPLVYEAVRYVTKVGVITRPTWNEFFCKGTARWKRKQLRILLQSKVFKQHPCDELVDTFIIGNFGQEMVSEMKWRAVHFVQPQFVKHDEAVGKGLLQLERVGVCKKWITEQELKARRATTFKLDVRDGGDKYPDAVFSLNGKTSSLTVALEYEKTAKTNWRYNKAIKAYSNTGDFQLILFVVEKPSIEDAIKRGLSFVADGRLNSKVGFISVDDWRENPMTAEIRGVLKNKTLNEIVEKL